MITLRFISSASNMGRIPRLFWNEEDNIILIVPHKNGTQAFIEHIKKNVLVTNWSEFTSINPPEFWKKFKIIDELIPDPNYGRGRHRKIGPFRWRPIMEIFPDVEINEGDRNRYWLEMEFENYVPDIYVFLRDPVQRFLSFAAMTIKAADRAGYSLSIENFNTLEYSGDNHCMSQISLLPVVVDSSTEHFWQEIFKEELLRKALHDGNGGPPEIDTYQLDTNSILYQGSGQEIDINTMTSWPKFLGKAKLHKYLVKGLFKFLYNDGNVNLLDDFCKHVNVPQTGVQVHSSKQVYNGYPAISDSQLEYVKEVYQHDYKMLESIQFINKPATYKIRS